MGEIIYEAHGPKLISITRFLGGHGVGVPPMTICYQINSSLRFHGMAPVLAAGMSVLPDIKAVEVAVAILKDALSPVACENAGSQARISRAWARNELGQILAFHGPMRGKK